MKLSGWPCLQCHTAVQYRMVERRKPHEQSRRISDIAIRSWLMLFDVLCGVLPHVLDPTSASHVN